MKKEEEIELSVVIPCLNEEETLGICLDKVIRVFQENQIAGELIVADNGSTDNSRKIAEEKGARVISVSEKGYGSALMGGIQEARGKFVLMGDADDSYDFLEIPKFLTKIREGHDLVQGCRLPTGGGTVAKGAMPFTHRWIGNPILTFLVRRMFGVPIHDVYCGMRCFTKKFYLSLKQRCKGMEFATEMIIRASLFHGDIAEVPITLHKDGRINQTPHLRTFRDGWRTLRFFLLCSPRWLFLYPGALFLLLGLAGYAIAMPGVSIGGISFDAHTLLFASMSILCGFQAIGFAVFAKIYSINEGFMPEDSKFSSRILNFNLEKGLLSSIFLLVCGSLFLINSILIWKQAEFGHLDYARTMRVVIPGITLFVLGVQTMFFSFFMSLFELKNE